jgi:hypothetical protein
VEDDPEYMKRMTNPNNEFYNYVRRRIRESLPQESQFVPDPVEQATEIDGSSSPSSSAFEDATESAASFSDQDKPE